MAPILPCPPKSRTFSTPRKPFSSQSSRLTEAAATTTSGRHRDQNPDRIPSRMKTCLRTSRSRSRRRSWKKLHPSLLLEKTSPSHHARGSKPSQDSAVSKSRTQAGRFLWLSGLQGSAPGRRRSGSRHPSHDPFCPSAFLLLLIFPLKVLSAVV